MSQRIVIDPVTRIEGHAKISIHLDDAGRVEDARLHIAEFRGFERFCEGRSFRELPVITSRICGICPVSHMLASVKAGDALLAVEVPATAKDLRRIVNLGQLVQSHALSFFHLSAPDWIVGYDAPPEERSVVGLFRREPELARDGIRLRAFGQQVIAAVTGKRIHPAWAVPGGVAAPLAPEAREALLAALPEALAIAERTLARFKRALPERAEEAATFGDFETLHMGMVDPDGTLEHYDGRLRLVSASGEVLADQVDPARFEELIGEAVEPWSYLKFPYYRPWGYPAGIYRVGPLSRLNAAARCGTPRADQELLFFRDLARGPVHASFHYHLARLVEILHALEKVQRLLDDPAILSRDVLAVARRNRLEGVGACEAPRGTLFHHYRVLKGGIVTEVNLVIATGQNNLAMNRTITQIARHFLDGRKITDGLLNRVEAGVRAYDPCLSCSTHAVGQLPLRVELRGPGGELIDAAVRGEGPTGG
ncbi:Ni/Fe hydrogenase subunit alpha [Anaeromyxobacter paludicola]|uniref:NADP oxidoreductase n=1 Tax=Anaeromyxobacter paludicola TaxID=2918171 RepID=A0ABM7XAC9_9BACT|nr:Ni/Fe hydrogenase subunit alpha [Anaeromyxobacter paludicola]BDG08806.1 NADP oxidoreductase [Anaeromyxobacter paludicola]